MKTAFFVESINVKEVPLIRMDDHQFGVRYHKYKMVDAKVASNELIGVSEGVEEIIVPAHEFCRLEGAAENLFQTILDPPLWKRTYIALSKEVQDYLKLPIDILGEELNTCKKQVTANKGVISRQEARLSSLDSELVNCHYVVETANLWSRLRFLFTRKF